MKKKGQPEGGEGNRRGDDRLEPPRRPQRAGEHRRIVTDRPRLRFHSSVELGRSRCINLVCLNSTPNVRLPRGAFTQVRAHRNGDVLLPDGVGVPRSWSTTTTCSGCIRRVRFLGCRRSRTARRKWEVRDATGYPGRLGDDQRCNHCPDRGLAGRTPNTYTVRVKHEEWASAPPRTGIRPRGACANGSSYTNEFSHLPVRTSTLAVRSPSRDRRFGTGIRRPSTSTKRQREVGSRCSAPSIPSTSG